jgi:AbrB family looped-hinge helix DNA binding protein
MLQNTSGKEKGEVEYDKTVRTIDELGRVVLPKDVRKRLQWEEKTKVEVQLDEARGEVILKRLNSVNQ